jgi:hypothetical protein
MRSPSGYSIYLDRLPVTDTRTFFLKKKRVPATHKRSQRQVTPVKNTRGSTMNVTETMRWLWEHLVDFPNPYIAKQFQQNGCADCNERIALLPDQRLQAEEDRKKRAQGVLDTCQVGFDGREPMNTLMCVLYSPNAVSKLVRAAYDDADDSNRLAHVFVLRVGEVFLLLLTASPYKRFPLDTFMRVGDHTSAYMWLNLKEKCWEPYSLKSAKKKKQKCWQQLSQATVSGLHILSVFWRRSAIQVLPPPAVAGVADGTVSVMQHHVYVKPPQTSLTVVQHDVPVATGGDGEDAPTVAPPDAWVLEVERFANQFAAPLVDEVEVVETEVVEKAAAVETEVV